VRLAVLAVLLEGPRHPYQMQRVLQDRHKDYTNGRGRALYHAVVQLQRRALIEPVQTSREGRRPERTVYRITPEGREQFESWLTDLLRVPDAAHPLFTAAVSFLGYLSPDRALSCLRDRAVALEIKIAALQGAMAALRDRAGLPRLATIEHEHTLALARAELDWVRSLVDDMESGRLRWPDDWLRQASEGQPAATSAPATTQGGE
jgi:DNA-binding PadR family transcriptional regulator